MSSDICKTFLDSWSMRNAGESPQGERRAGKGKRRRARTCF